MAETIHPWDEALPRQVEDSLLYLSGVVGPGGYELLPNGDLRYPGTRPGPDWHGHGYFPKTITMLSEGSPQPRRVHKHRWRQSGTNTTVHSKPPEDIVRIGPCVLIVFLMVWAVLNSKRGFWNREEVFEDLDQVVSDRTVQRWLARALEEALEIQQAYRLAIIETRRSEPRPGEDPVFGGLSPPISFGSRDFKNPFAAETLWRACAMLLVASNEQGIPVSHLLAVARRRYPKRERPILF